MGFNTNYSAVQDNNLKPEGDYEVIIAKIEERTTSNKKTGLNLSLVIRNDIPTQKYQNAYLFHTLWKSINPTPDDLSVNGYIFWKIMELGKAVGLPDGKAYANLDEYLNDIINKPIKVTVEHEAYKGVERETITELKKTDYPDCRHVMKKKQNQTGSGFVQPQTNTYANTNNYANTNTTAYVPTSYADEDLPF